MLYAFCMADLLLLHSFLEVAESGTISRAAQHLFVTQPALSRRLQQLEQELGATLFVRTPRGVALTEEGRYVQREARFLLERYAHLKDGVAALANLEAGTVRIGGGATAVSFLLPEAIAEFQRTHPGVLFQVKEAGSRDVERDVAAERIELGIVTLPIEPTLAGELEVTPLVRDRILLVAAADHPLAQRKRVPVSALEGQDIVGFESPSAIRSLIDSALREVGVQVNVVMELRSIPAILRMVTTTGRMAFVSQLGIGPPTRGRAEEIITVNVTGLKITRDLAVIARKGRPLSPASVAFARELKR
jgi:DNA-binding transcriptional LysR family regulator